MDTIGAGFYGDGSLLYPGRRVGIDGPVGRPVREHPGRPVLGFAQRRSEVSGARLWGWASQEWFLDYFRSRVTVTVDENSSALLVQAEGFDPDFAFRLILGLRGMKG